MISVLLPVRNGSSTLGAALESLRQQSLLPAQVVVIDDGSTDSTSTLLKDWQRKWPAIEVLTTPAQGLSRALNLGLTRCTQRWVARMDADDLSHPCRFASQLELAENDPNLALVGAQVEHVAITALQDSGMQRYVAWANSKLLHTELAQALWIDSPLPHPTWFVRHDTYREVGNYTERTDIPEDYEWLHRFFALSKNRPDLRATKVHQPALLTWQDSPTRLTRTHASSTYSFSAFDRVKCEFMKHLISADHEIFVAALGPKGKAILPLIKKCFPQQIKAALDVNPRRIGETYLDLPVWDIVRWKRYLADHSNPKPFVVSCVGTMAARSACEALYTEMGYTLGESFISI